MPFLQSLRVLQRFGPFGQLVSRASIVLGISLMGRHRSQDSPPAMALMLLPWLYWILLMPATSSPANLCAAGPHPILPCASESPVSAMA